MFPVFLSSCSCGMVEIPQVDGDVLLSPSLRRGLQYCGSATCEYVW